MRQVSVSAVVLCAIAPYAAAQFSPVTQERSVMTQATVSSGGSAGDFDEATNFGPFFSPLAATIGGAGGASANAAATQDSVLSPSLISGVFSADCDVATGSTFITGEADAQSRMLYIFNVAAPTQVEFRATAQIVFRGLNPDGEPSDLYGLSSVRLLDANTEQVIAMLQLNTGEFDIASFDGTLPTGQYVILASTQMHAFSADLLGPPNRSGSGAADLSFSLTAVPAPGAAALLGLGALGFSRRRRTA